jgi:hypothetical protein
MFEKLQKTIREKNAAKEKAQSGMQDIEELI